MGYSYLLESPDALATFRSTFSIPDDVDVAYATRVILLSIEDLVQPFFL